MEPARAGKVTQKGPLQRRGPYPFSSRRQGLPEPDGSGRPFASTPSARSHRARLRLRQGSPTAKTRSRGRPVPLRGRPCPRSARARCRMPGSDARTRASARRPRGLRTRSHSLVGTGWYDPFHLVAVADFERLHLGDLHAPLAQAKLQVVATGDLAALAARAVFVVEEKRRLRHVIPLPALLQPRPAPAVQPTAYGRHASSSPTSLRTAASPASSATGGYRRAAFTSVPGSWMFVASRTSGMCGYGARPSPRTGGSMPSSKLVAGRMVQHMLSWMEPKPKG